MGQVDNKVAIVTGAANGIGRASAIALATEGAKVLLADINPIAGIETVEAIEKAGGIAKFIRTDVSDEGQVKGMIDQAITLWGRLDILMNNAASGQRDDIDTVTNDRETWDRTFGATLFGAVYGSRHAIPVMIKNGGGSIINVSSNATINGDYVRVAYAAAKAGVNSLSMYNALVFGKQGVRSNVISPGVLVTEPVLRLYPEELRKAMADFVPSPRMGSPDDAGRLAVFLSSDAASFINGQVISVDGGLSASGGLATILDQMGANKR